MTRTYTSRVFSDRYLSSSPEMARLLSAIPVIPDVRRQSILSQLVADLKSNSLWNDIYGLWIFNQDNQQNIYYNLKNPVSFNLFDGIRPQIKPDEGLSGYGLGYLTTQWLLNNIVPSNTDVLMTVFHNDNIAETGNSYGVTDGTSQITLKPRTASNQCQHTMNSASAANTSAGTATNSQGQYIQYRVNGTQSNVTFQGVNRVQTIASQALPTKEMFVMAFNNNGTVGSITTRGIKYLAICKGSINATLLGTILATYQTNIDTYPSTFNAELTDNNGNYFVNSSGETLTGFIKHGSNTSI